LIPALRIKGQPVSLDEIFHGQAKGLIILPGHSAQGGNREIDQCELLGGAQGAAVINQSQNLPLN